MSLPPRQSALWSDEIAAVATDSALMNVTVKFYDTTKVLKLTTKGRFQHKRSTLDASNATAWETKRAAHVQIPLTAIAGLVSKGWIAQISAGVDDATGATIPLRDPTLALVSFTVQSAVNSSHAALRTVELMSELAPTPRA